MSSIDALGLIDTLYERAVLDPAAIEEPLLIEWMEQASESTRGDREQAKPLRKAMRTARKLAAYWSERDASALPDWRNGVDEALGARGWECQLTLATAALKSDPDEELFETVKELYRIVHFIEWMDGVSFEEWSDG